MLDTYGMAILGGVLIGGSASLLLFKIGYPVGISGYLSKAMSDPRKADWRWGFLVGMLLVGLVGGFAIEGSLVDSLGVEQWKLILGAICVGAGARIAGGCTSGHSLCGMGRLDRDSIVATLVFIAAGAGTVLIFGA